MTEPTAQTITVFDDATADEDIQIIVDEHMTGGLASMTIKSIESGELVTLALTPGMVDQLRAALAGYGNEPVVEVLFATQVDEDYDQVSPSYFDRETYVNPDAAIRHAEAIRAKAPTRRMRVVKRTDQLVKEWA